MKIWIHLSSALYCTGHHPHTLGRNPLEVKVMIIYLVLIQNKTLLGGERYFDLCLPEHRDKNIEMQKEGRATATKILAGEARGKKTINSVDAPSDR